MANVAQYVLKARDIMEAIDAEGRRMTAEEKAEISDLLDKAEATKRVTKATLAGQLSGSAGVGLFEQFKSAGWTPTLAQKVYVSDSGIRLASASFDGSTDDLSPVRREGYPLPVENARYIHPAFATVAEDRNTSSVQYIRQKSRTLASASDVVRDFDEDSSKPEVASVRELTSEPMHQVAAVETAVPNNILSQPGFASMIELDLRASILAGYDQLVTDAIGGASPTLTTPGADLIQSLRQAIEDLAALGYNPSTALLSPSDAVSLDLTQSAGEEAFYVFGPGQFASAPFGLRVRISDAVSDPMVVDPAAFGELHATGLSLATFEESAGSTNTSTVRLEGNAAFCIQREKALTVIGDSSV
jgi:hypothetical protein